MFHVCSDRHCFYSYSSLILIASIFYICKFKCLDCSELTWLRWNIPSSWSSSAFSLPIKGQVTSNRCYYTFIVSEQQFDNGYRGHSWISLCHREASVVEKPQPTGSRGKYQRTDPARCCLWTVWALSVYFWPPTKVSGTGVEMANKTRHFTNLRICLTVLKRWFCLLAPPPTTTTTLNPKQIRNCFLKLCFLSRRRLAVTNGGAAL